MSEVEIYTGVMCGFCTAAKRLLREKGVNFVEMDVTSQPGKRDEMIERTNGRRTVPQIFIKGEYIGGCDDLYTLEANGELDTILGSPS
ncbi:MAG: glutaredoxin 3 [Alphaproteobacteria bacterium]|nr:glutaredoxin 3 [Alphaproteobacteria bacterium]